jgi:hypothetical protein
MAHTPSLWIWYRNAFSVASVAIFTQLNLIWYGDVLTCTLAATDETKRPRQVQTNFESFSFYRHVACYHPLHHSSLAIFL